VIKALRERGIEPLVTLCHYTYPTWFTKRGRWLHKQAEKSFLRYVEKIVYEFKNDVRYWITFNEPETFVRHSYIQAHRLPQKRSIFKAIKALKKLVQAHKNVYHLIHRIGGDRMRVGLAESLVFFESYNRWPHNLLFKYIFELWRNKQFVPKVVSHSDFIGLQYYFHSRIRINPFVSWKGFQFNENKRVNDMGWEIYPKGIYYKLLDLKKYNKPIYITENGLADKEDKHRADFIRDHLKYVHRAIQDGVDVRGYFHWSLLDNFEWSDGFWPKFGLYEVDRECDFKRIARPSAKVYAEICKSNKMVISNKR